ncbi:hypothetical protein, partial [Salmonella sp. SAL4438]|uniref:hypothetical protein n=1 Tax=Salmonella sp. SAL4438 TaxID=3159893 RepID=UPI00397B7B7E
MFSRHPHFTPPSPDVERRVQSLLDRLELDEKLLLLGGKPGRGGAQANSATFPIERVGLPELRMA